MTALIILTIVNLAMTTAVLMATAQIKGDIHERSRISERKNKTV